jgi:hypothetical protein
MDAINEDVAQVLDFIRLEVNFLSCLFSETRLFHL